MYNCVWYFCTYTYGLSLNGRHSLFCIANNRHGVTMTTHAVTRYFLIWMTTMRQPTKRRRSCVLTLKYTFICVYWWTRQIIHNTLTVVDRYLRLIGDKTIPDSAEPRLESCFNIKIHIYLCLLVNETKNPQHLDRGRSIPATHGGLNDSRLGGASSGIVLSPIRRRYRSTTSRCSGFL